jgi:hypothetical protein
VRELDGYVAKGSQVIIVADIPDIERQIRGATGNIVNQDILIKQGDIRDRTFLEELNAASYDHIIVLAYSHMPPQDADAVTLVTLLHLRDIAERDNASFSIISEMLDLRNRELAEAAKVDDFIVSEHLISLMMVQLSENPALISVFDSIFDSAGSEIYLKPIEEYVSLEGPVNFYSVLEAARRRGETAIGYRLMDEVRDAEKSYGVHTNPRKNKLVNFTAGDKVIVVSEH